jgi:surfeit locus 1 family protein
MRRFQPSLVPTIATLVVCPLLASLGFWQLDRAGEKRELAASFAAGQLRPVEPVNKQMLLKLDSLQWKPVAGTGKYSPVLVLLDNRIRDGVVGYEIISPLAIDDGTTVLIDRGWVPGGANRESLPSAEAINIVANYRGNLGPPPSTGIAINKHNVDVETLAEQVFRVQKIDFDVLAAKLKMPLIPSLLYLHNESRHGYKRDWATPGFKPEKHEAYATQWFIMAIIVAGLYIGLNFKETSNR